MSEQDLPLPPVPEHTPPLKEDEVGPGPGKYFNQVWNRWFTSLRTKVNVINDAVTTLSQLVGNGIVVMDGGAATTVSRTDLIAGSNVSFDVSGENRILDNGDGPLTINAAGGGGGGGYIGWLASFMPTNVLASEAGFKLTRSGGGNNSRPVYHLIGKTSGKYALRFLLQSSSATIQGPGVGLLSGNVGTFLGASGGISAALWPNNGATTNDATYLSGALTSRGNLADFTSPTEVMFELDIDNGNLWIGVAGSWIGGGDPALGTSPTYSITPGIFYSPVADMFYTGMVQMLLPGEFITPASAGFIAGWPS